MAVQVKIQAIGKGRGEIHFSVIFGFEFVSLLRFVNDRVGKSQGMGEYKCTVSQVLAQLQFVCLFVSFLGFCILLALKPEEEGGGGFRMKTFCLIERCYRFIKNHISTEPLLFEKQMRKLIFALYILCTILMTIKCNLELIH